jgi:pSer/pThr/pTyr-binding forkhead associated (FHA) protein
MAWLYRIQADGSPAECWVLEEKPLVVGRGDFADAYVEDDALSQSHFLVVREGDGFFIVDLHSRNGTRVNGNRVAAHKLHANEFILAGQSLFCFVEPAVAEYAPPPAATGLVGSAALQEASQAG